MSCLVSPYVFGNRNRHYNLSCGVSIGQYDGALTVFTRIFSETKGKEGMNTLVTFEYAQTWFVTLCRSIHST